jgi:hypothetical protein
VTTRRANGADIASFVPLSDMRRHCILQQGVRVQDHVTFISSTAVVVTHQ